MCGWGGPLSFMKQYGFLKPQRCCHAVKMALDHGRTPETSRFLSECVSQVKSFSCERDCSLSCFRLPGWISVFEETTRHNGCIMVACLTPCRYNPEPGK